jgi:hypothetical protein
MTPLHSLLPSRRAQLAIDAVLAAWAVLWVCLGIAIANEVRGLRQLSGTVTKIGGALQQTGQTLDGLADAPLVGDRVGAAATQIRDAGSSTIESGRISRSSIHDLSWMLGVFVAVIPTVPILGLYVPLRVAVERERRAARRAAAAGGSRSARR